MRFGVKFSAVTVIISSALAGSAFAQTTAAPVYQTPVPNTTVPSNPSQYTNTAEGDMAHTPDMAPPGTVNEGTLAESANTTALASSTYHQPTGFLPGMKP